MLLCAAHMGIGAPQIYADTSVSLCRAIIEASQQPMSIIIIGIGNADFGVMNSFDSDGTALAQGGAVAARDIVQFVPFNVFRGNGVALAAEVLKELPDQICDYMKCDCH
jgi:copine 5/8/9